MKFFLALSFEHRKELAPVIAQIKLLLGSEGHTMEAFVEKKFSTPPDPHRLMEEALIEIQSADVAT